MTQVPTEETPDSVDKLSKIYSKTDNTKAKIILVISLSGGLIGSFAGYFMWGFIDEWFALLAIPCTIVFILAFSFTLFRFVYSRRDSTKKRSIKDLTKLADEELSEKIKKKRILSIILLVITMFFVILSIVLTSISMSSGELLALYFLIWMVPGIFPGVFLIIEYKQIQKFKSELDNRSTKSM